MFASLFPAASIRSFPVLFQVPTHSSTPIRRTTILWSAFPAMGTQQPPPDWRLEQRFNAPSQSTASPNSLHRLQSTAPSAQVHIVCEGIELRSSESGPLVSFAIHPSPLQPHSELLLRLRPIPKKNMGEKEWLYTEDTVSVLFLAYDDMDNTPHPRVPHTFHGAKGTNTTPTGPIDFSHQLYQVQWSKYPNSPVSGKVCVISH